MFFYTQVVEYYILFIFCNYLEVLGVMVIFCLEAVSYKEIRPVLACLNPIFQGG